ncbi:ABC transporter ATP-binding protein [Candidatus Acetothermia bacterium]|nr:ABC transporter ATP-binding protein [Candidatus Acetothermia bacterium]
MSVINVKNLVKKFGDLTAVNEISFEVQQGEVFGMLGPNGAGKTTTLEIIEGIQEPTSGQTSVLGMDSQKQSDEVKERIGVQLQASAYFDNLTLGEILDLFGSFYKKQLGPDKLLESVELRDKKNSLVKHLSGGQKQRFSIAASVVNDPELVFLDEPTTGLDPQARRHLWEYIRQINQQGKTIILTTHYMEEAQRLCDRVAIIDMGKIVALDTPANLINNLKSSYRINLTFAERMSAEIFKQVQGVIDARELTGDDQPQPRVQLRVNKAMESLPSLLGLVEQQAIRLEDIEMQPANLEDVFLELTGKELRD